MFDDTCIRESELNPEVAQRLDEWLVSLYGQCLYKTPFDEIVYHMTGALEEYAIRFDDVQEAIGSYGMKPLTREIAQTIAAKLITASALKNQATKQAVIDAGDRVPD